MKKIDAWLDIQRFIAEVGNMPIRTAPSEVEIFARASHKQSKGRTLINNHKSL